MSIYLGEIAAILTALCWTFTATFFSMAGKDLGSVVVNRVRLVLAVLFLTVTHWLMYGQPFPVGIEWPRFLWLAFSGVVGLVIADALLFQSYVWIGARLGMLLLSSSPVVATLLARIFLGEQLHWLQIAGVLLTVSGIAWVVLDRNGQNGLYTRNPNYLWGILFGIGAATGQAIGLIAAKKGMGTDFPPLSANLIRMISAVTVLWGITLVQRQATVTIRRFLAHPQAMRYVLAGAFFGPFVGVWLSLVAVQLTHIGVASTLMALAPIFMLPVGRFIFKEQVGWTAVLGTLVAVAGVSLLFWG